MGNRIISEFISGEPKAQPRVKASRRGAFISIYTPPTADEWKALVREGLSRYEGTYEKRMALSISLEFTFKRPASHFKKDGNLRKGINENHVQKPDFDNLAKAVVDAIGDANVWHDDCQIVQSAISKEWGDTCGCEIVIAEK